MKQLSISHHIYTSSQKKRGYYTIYMSTSLESFKEDLERQGFYRRPRGNSEEDFALRPTSEEELKKFPVRLHYYILEDGRAAFCHSVYKGRDNHSRSPRFGNYYSHTVVMDNSKDWVSTIQLFKDVDWQTGKLEDELGSLPEFCNILEDQVAHIDLFFAADSPSINALESSSLLQDANRINILGHLIDKLIEVPEKRFLIIDEAHLLHWWMLAIHAAFPPPLGKKVYFDAYTAEPNKSKVQIMGYPTNASPAELVIPQEVSVLNIQNINVDGPHTIYAQTICSILRTFPNAPEEAETSLREIFGRLEAAGIKMISPQLNVALEFHQKLQEIKDGNLTGSTLHSFVRRLGQDWLKVERVLNAIKKWAPDEYLYFLKIDISRDPKKIRSFIDLWEAMAFDDRFLQANINDLTLFLLQYLSSAAKVESAEAALSQFAKTPKLLDDSTLTKLGDIIFGQLQLRTGDEYFSNDMKYTISLLQKVGYNSAKFSAFKQDWEMMFNFLKRIQQSGQSQDKRQKLFNILNKVSINSAPESQLQAINYVINVNNSNDFDWLEADLDEIEKFELLFSQFQHSPQFKAIEKSLLFSGTYLKLKRRIKESNFEIQTHYVEISQLEKRLREQVINDLPTEHKKQFWKLELKQHPQDEQILKRAIEDGGGSTDEDALEYLEVFFSTYPNGRKRETAGEWAFRFITNDSNFILTKPLCAEYLCEEASTMLKHPDFQYHAKLIKWIKFLESKHSFKIKEIPEEVQQLKLYEFLRPLANKKGFKVIEELIEERKYLKDIQSLLSKIEEDFFGHPFSHENWMIFFEMLESNGYNLADSIIDIIDYIKKDYKIYKRENQPVNAWLLTQIIIAIILLKDHQLLIDIGKRFRYFGNNFFMTSSSSSKFTDKELVGFIRTSIMGLSPDSQSIELFNNIIGKAENI